VPRKPPDYHVRLRGAQQDGTEHACAGSAACCARSLCESACVRCSTLWLCSCAPDNSLCQTCTLGNPRLQPCCGCHAVKRSRPVVSKCALRSSVTLRLILTCPTACSSCTCGWPRASNAMAKQVLDVMAKQVLDDICADCSSFHDFIATSCSGGMHRSTGSLPTEIQVQSNISGGRSTVANIIQLLCFMLWPWW